MNVSSYCLDMAGIVITILFKAQQDMAKMYIGGVTLYPLESPSCPCCELY